MLYSGISGFQHTYALTIWRKGGVDGEYCEDWDGFNWLSVGYNEADLLVI